MVGDGGRWWEMVGDGVDLHEELVKVGIVGMA